MGKDIFLARSLSVIIITVMSFRKPGAAWPDRNFTYIVPNNMYALLTIDVLCLTAMCASVCVCGYVCVSSGSMMYVSK